MPPIFKPGSAAGRPKSASHKSSIRGTISGPIPIPTAEDDEFPIRIPGSSVATTSNDDEFPIRRPGTNIASPVPPDEHDGSDAPPQVSKDSQQFQQPEQSQQSLQSPEDHPQQQQQQPFPEAQSPDPQLVPAHPGSGYLPSASVPSLMAPLEPRVVLSSPSPARSPPPRKITLSISPQFGPVPRQLDSPFRVPPPEPVSLLTPNRTTTRSSTTAGPRYSTISEAPSSSQTNQSRDAPQRKKSTLRSALGKLFGRNHKKRSGAGSTSSAGFSDANTSPNASAVSGRMSSQTRSSHQPHRSDPSALTRMSPKEGDHRRLTSLPVTDFDRPLRSHSVGPDDIMAIESARTSMQNEVRAAVTDVSPISPGGASRRRAATTSRTTGNNSHPLFSHPRTMRDSEWGRGLSPRPASSIHQQIARQQHLRGTGSLGAGLGASGFRHEGREDPEEIGRAITSDSNHATRRRSRSLSGLQDFAIATSAVGVKEELGLDSRRRSDEIRYWRNSYNLNLGSPLSSPTDGPPTGLVPIDEPHGLDTESPAQASDTNSLDTPSMGLERSSEAGLDVRQRQDDTPQVADMSDSTPQPFNFELISQDMGPKRIPQTPGMESRLSHLEVRASRLERVVDQLCHAVPGFHVPMMEMAGVSSGDDGQTDHQPYEPSLPPGSPGQSGVSSSRASVDSFKANSFGEPHTSYLGSSLHPPSSSATHSLSLAATSTTTAPTSAETSDMDVNTATITPAVTISDLADRPASRISSTVRDAASVPTIGRSNSDSGSDRSLYQTLAVQLETERAARLALEAQVSKLAERLNSLSTTMYAMLRDPSKPRSYDRLNTPSHQDLQRAAASSTQGSPVGSTYALGGSSSSVQQQQQQQQQQQHYPYFQPKKALRALSVFDTEDKDGSDQDVEERNRTRSKKGEEDDIDEDSFQTPQEEATPRFGGFGGEADDEDDEEEEDGDEYTAGGAKSHRKAARTLSLSQLTYNKGMQYAMI